MRTAVTIDNCDHELPKNRCVFGLDSEPNADTLAVLVK